MAGEDLQFDLPRRIAHGNPQEEAVELTFRQGVGALELDGVLRGDDHERPGQGVRLPVDRHLPFAHGLQQGARVRGVARLISSARTMLAKIGPGLKANCRDSAL